MVAAAASHAASRGPSGVRPSQLFLSHTYLHRQLHTRLLGRERFLSTGCSCRRPRFSSQHSRGSFNYLLTAVPGDLLASSVLHRHKAFTWYTNINVDKTPVQIFLKK